MNQNLVRAIGLALAVAASALAQTTVTGPASSAGGDASSPPKASKVAGYPFRGKLKAVDKQASTFTLAGKSKDRVFHITPETKFVRDGKAVSLTDGVAGDDVAGYARNQTDGKTQALTVRFGTVAPTDPQKTPTRKAPRPKAETSAGQ